MIEFHQLNLDLAKSDSVSLAEKNYYLNQMADRSIQIENIFKKDPVSYTVLHYIKTESDKYRPSKRLLQNTLKKYFEQEFSKYGLDASNVLNISTLDSKIKFKFLAVESVLSFDQILATLREMKSIAPVLILYNNYRGNYFLYAKDSIEKGSEIDEYFNDVHEKIKAQNPETFLVQSKSNYRVLKSIVNKDKHPTKKNQIYFTF